MINCQEAKELINIKLDGQLDNIKEKQLEEHLSKCSNCNEYSRQLNKLHANLLSLPNIGLQNSIVDQLIAEENLLIPLKPQKKSWYTLKPWSGFVAAALLLILIIPLVNMYNQSEFKSLQNSTEYQYAETAPSQEKADVSTQTDSNQSQIMGLTAMEDGKDKNNNTANDTSDDIKEPEATVEFNVTEIPSVKSPEALNIVSSDSPLRIENLDQQLTIYVNNQEVFKTHKWNKDLTVKWEIKNENQIEYYLFSNDGKMIEKYLINLIEKKEEKIK